MNEIKAVRLLQGISKPKTPCPSSQIYVFSSEYPGAPKPLMYIADNIRPSISSARLPIPLFQHYKNYVLMICVQLLTSDDVPASLSSPGEERETNSEQEGGKQEPEERRVSLHHSAAVRSIFYDLLLRTVIILVGACLEYIVCKEICTKVLFHIIERKVATVSNACLDCKCLRTILSVDVAVVMLQGSCKELTIPPAATNNAATPSSARTTMPWSISTKHDAIPTIATRRAAPPQNAPYPCKAGGEPFFMSLFA
jgi:hypothetical protein